MLKQSTSFSTLTSPSLADKEPEEQELELPMLEARKRNPSLFSEDDLPSPSSISAERRRKEPVRFVNTHKWLGALCRENCGNHTLPYLRVYN